MNIFKRPWPSPTVREPLHKFCDCGLIAQSALCAVRSRRYTFSNRSSHTRCVTCDAKLLTRPVQLGRTARLICCDQLHRDKRTAIQDPILLRRRRLALDGAGVTMLPIWMAKNPAIADELVPVLRDWRPHSLPLCALYSGTSGMTPKVKAFLDFMTGYLGTDRICREVDQIVWRSKRVCERITGMSFWDFTPSSILRWWNTTLDFAQSSGRRSFSRNLRDRLCSSGSS
jgi:hypothetical protein